MLDRAEKFFMLDGTPILLAARYLGVSDIVYLSESNKFLNNLFSGFMAFPRSLKPKYVEINQLASECDSAMQEGEVVEGDFDYQRHNNNKISDIKEIINFGFEYNLSILPSTKFLVDYKNAETQYNIYKRKGNMASYFGSKCPVVILRKFCESTAELPFDISDFAILIADANANTLFGGGKSKQSNLHSLIITGKPKHACLLAAKLSTIRRGLSSVDEQGNTALHLAISKGYFALTIDLIRGGASLTVPNQQGITPLAAGLLDKNYKAFFKIISDNICESPLNGVLWHISKIGCLEKADFIALIKCVGDINCVYGEEKTTPLHNALYKGTKQGIKYAKLLMIEGNASVQIADARGNTPLHLAAGNNQMCDIAKMLVTRGADKDQKNADGLAPSDIAKDVLRCKGTAIHSGSHLYCIGKLKDNVARQIK